MELEGIEQYRQNAVTTQTPERLIIMLYEGAIRFLKRAKSSLRDNDLVEFAACMSKAGNIIDELDIALDLEVGGDVAANLRSLYDFLRRHLLRAQIKKNVQLIDEAIRILEDLNDGWKSIVD